MARCEEKEVRMTVISPTDFRRNRANLLAA